ncbi:mechanosensitive ion channel family protein [Endozoicomonas sp. Mp262]|uniref:mechanosensitive ion channel family protein n=1 Tax=Endozoicomonas sp. Mp262 TaxID=2919499 RepID=UPI0021DB466F
MEFFADWVALKVFSQGYIVWLGQCLVILSTAAIGSYLARRAIGRLSLGVNSQTSPYFSAVAKAARLPASLSVWLMALGWILNLSGSTTQLPILQAIPLIQRIALILLLGWFLISFTNTCYRNLQCNQFKNSSLNANSAEVIYKLVQLLIVISFGLMLLQSAGISISGILAFGGIGGLAVGLAAKDMMANLFGGLVLYLDRPFHVGEKIRIINTQIEGWVEEIGWRQTRIRNYDRQPIYVPNALFGNSAVINPSRISNRRIRQMIGLRYQDIASVPAITKSITEYIRNHREIDQVRPVEVRLIEYGASSLDLQIYCFAACTDYEDLLRIQEDILLNAGKIIHSHGADIAFPTRTLDFQWPPNNNP